ncbi:hypothetical protein KZZ52_35590 [Dactylosporangium sp. AC04546]|uniref:hypothetical protein n=1 Tax=Dactylosporangium sp. AC04546 TaxID=2862460 RepID=UPI001EDD9ECF|nr:hypothetical protein [Dactylosporangium sp. AC04546]WVK79295.1 hypothetical protein KZZ52_35590 [Dactylosporangium sp. AC04546]
MDDSRFDLGLLVAASLAVLAVGAGCLLGVDWVRPPDADTGPFVTPGRQRGFLIAAAVLVAAGLLCGARWWWTDEDDRPLVAAGLMVVIIAILATALYLPRPMLEVRDQGFARPGFSARSGGHLVLYNSSRIDVVVCLGVSGDCDASAPGPAALRSPGLRLPANHRVRVDMPSLTGEFRLTLVDPGPGVTRRDLLLHAVRSA